MPRHSVVSASAKGLKTFWKHYLPMSRCSTTLQTCTMCTCYESCLPSPQLFLSLLLAMLRLAAHAHVRLVSVIMCGERSSFFVVNTHVPASKLTQPLCHGAESDQRYAGAHASVRLVSSTMCREALRSMLTTHARIHRALHTCSLRHHVQRARRASAGATHTCLPRLSHHVRRVCGAYCGRHMHVSSSSPPQYAESAARFFGRHTQEFASSPPSRAESAARYASATHTCPPRLFHHLRRALRAAR